MLLDSHCHLNDLDLTALGCQHVGEAIDKAVAEGVDRFWCINVDWQSWPAVRDIIESDDRVHGSVGVHPCHVHDVGGIDQDLLHRHAQHERVILLGETGLDYYHDDSPELRERQKRALIQHIEVSQSVAKPLVIHSRAAKQDTLAILKTQGGEKAGGIMHCFAEDWAMAEEALEMGFYISLSGIVTFKNAHNVHEVAKRVPMDRLLIETDAPYLAPMPYRGQTNTPAYLPHIAAKIAELKGLSYQEIASVTRANALALISMKKF